MSHEVRLLARAFTPPEGFEPFLPSARTHGVIQFFAVPTAAQHEAIRNAGIALHDYLPDLAYTATVRSRITSRELSGLGARALFSLEPRDKLAPEILEGAIGDWVRKEPGKIDVSVLYDPDVPFRPVPGASFVAPGGELELEILAGSTFFSHFDARVDSTGIAEIADLERVRWVAPAPPPFEPFNDCTARAST